MTSAVRASLMLPIHVWPLTNLENTACMFAQDGSFSAWFNPKSLSEFTDKHKEMLPVRVDGELVPGPQCCTLRLQQPGFLVSYVCNSLKLWGVSCRTGTCHVTLHSLNSESTVRNLNSVLVPLTIL